MTQQDDHEARFAALDKRVGTCERTAEAARLLASGAYKETQDLKADLRAFNKAVVSGFNATRADISDIKHDLTRQFADVNRRIDSLDQKVDRGFTDMHEKVDHGFAEMREKHAANTAVQQRIVQQLNAIIAQHKGA